MTTGINNYYFIPVCEYRMKQIFKKIITDFIERTITGIIPRETDIPLRSKMIISLAGIRRSGKTSVYFDMINRLRETESRENILYINFEDDRIFPLKLSDLDLLIEAYYELFPGKRDERVYLFLDEIHTVPDWELFVRRIYDTLNVSIYITGSSSKMQGAEVSTSLRGRTITFEIFPLSFREFLKFTNTDINLNSSKSLSYIKNSFEEYIKHGGFAELIGEAPEIKRRILSDYIDLIIYKDIIERFGVQNTSFLRFLIRYCFINVSTLVSLTRLYNDFKSQGHRIGKETLFDYFSHLEDVYTIFSVPVLRSSIKEENRNPKKIYSVDTGFKYLFEVSASPDMGRIFENLVFLHLRRLTREIFYFKQKQEVDFYTVVNNKKIIINVCNDFSAESTRRREINGLLEAMETLGVDESFLINGDIEDIVIIDKRKIIVMPLWKWLIEWNG